MNHKRILTEKQSPNLAGPPTDSRNGRDPLRNFMETAIQSKSSQSLISIQDDSLSSNKKKSRPGDSNLITYLQKKQQAYIKNHHPIFKDQGQRRPVDNAYRDYCMNQRQILHNRKKSIRRHQQQIKQQVAKSSGGVYSNLPLGHLHKLSNNSRCKAQQSYSTLDSVEHPSDQKPNYRDSNSTFSFERSSPMNPMKRQGSQLSIQQAQDIQQPSPAKIQAAQKGLSLALHTSQANIPKQVNESSLMDFRQKPMFEDAMNQPKFKSIYGSGVTSGASLHIAAAGPPAPPGGKALGSNETSSNLNLLANGSMTINSIPSAMDEASSVSIINQPFQQSQFLSQMQYHDSVFEKSSQLSHAKTKSYMQHIVQKNIIQAQNGQKKKKLRTRDPKESILNFVSEEGTSDHTSQSPNFISEMRSHLPSYLNVRRSSNLSNETSSIIRNSLQNSRIRGGGQSSSQLFEKYFAGDKSSKRDVSHQRLKGRHGYNTKSQISIRKNSPVSPGIGGDQRTKTDETEPDEQNPIESQFHFDMDSGKFLLHQSRRLPKLTKTKQDDNVLLDEAQLKEIQDNMRILEKQSAENLKTKSPTSFIRQGNGSTYIRRFDGLGRTGLRALKKGSIILPLPKLKVPQATRVKHISQAEKIKFDEGLNSVVGPGDKGSSLGAASRSPSNEALQQLSARAKMTRFNSPNRQSLNSPLKEDDRVRLHKQSRNLVLKRMKLDHLRSVLNTNSRGPETEANTRNTKRFLSQQSKSHRQTIEKQQQEDRSLDRDKKGVLKVEQHLLRTLKPQVLPPAVSQNITSFDKLDRHSPIVEAWKQSRRKHNIPRDSSHQQFKIFQTNENPRKGSGGRYGAYHVSKNSQEISSRLNNFKNEYQAIKSQASNQSIHRMSIDSDSVRKQGLIDRYKKFDESRMFKQSMRIVDHNLQAGTDVEDED